MPIPSRPFAVFQVKLAVCSMAVVLPINTCPAVKAVEPVPPLATANVPVKAFPIFKAVILAPAPAIFVAVKVSVAKVRPAFVVVSPLPLPIMS